MDAHQNDIELLQDFIRVIEAAITQDIHLRACPDSYALDFLPRRFDALDVLHGALLIQAIGDGYGLRMVGDEDVFIAELLGGLRHLLDAGLAIRGSGVHLQVTLDVPQFYQPGELTLLRRFDLAQVFAQLRGDPRQVELGVDFFLASPGQRFFPLEEAILA